jgi:hypothetical protein
MLLEKHWQGQVQSSYVRRTVAQIWVPPELCVRAWGHQGRLCALSHIGQNLGYGFR